MSPKRAPRRRDSEATRAAILAAARQRFAREGYERATIRAIASDVEVDPALVMRYFENKDKLFAVAADFDLRLPELSSVPRDEVGSTLVAHFIDRWEADDTFLALLRGVLTHDAADKRMRAVFRDQVAPAIAALSTDDASLDDVRAALIASQLLGMALCRYVLRIPAVTSMDRADVVAWLGPTIQRYVTGRVPKRSGATRRART
ncbi:MAG TPA: TetR family transcriptional regulator [Kofleriaceae bacterium]